VADFPCNHTYVMQITRPKPRLRLYGGVLRPGDAGRAGSGAEVRRVAAAHITVPEEESTSMLNDKTREPKPAGSVRGSLLS
jgi:hypothetical protein